MRKFRIPRSRKAKVILGASLIGWVVAVLLLARLSEWATSSKPGANFDEAVESVSQLGERDDAEYVNSPARYGITQAIYSDWRRAQGKLPQHISDLTLAEAKVIYRDFWQQGRCDRYAAPLDITCLDTIVSFGVENSESFFQQLSDDPQQAALEVVEQRQAYRYEITSGGYVRMGRRSVLQQRLLQEGLRRDRALITFIKSYTPTQTSESFDLRRLLGLDSSEQNAADENSTPSNESLDSTQDLSPEQIYTKAKPFTVEVWIDVGGTLAPATGVILTPDGLVLTAHHVIDEAPNPAIHLADGRKFEAEVIEADPTVDLALLQLKGASGLPTATLADSTTHIQVGDTVYAIGSPYGEHWKFSSAPVIQLQSRCGLFELECIRTPEDFLFPGHSGGPLLDTYGEVVAINRAIQQSTGEGVSVPIETVKEFVDRVRQ
ncbi:MAG: trypsin-like serine protease [Cyanobacteria bacterium CRU_2_1]|nr:trypsin-like serine protease [Cyanobacteria bacterium CRU_2_1]